MADIKFTGNVGADSELRFLPDGAAVLNFSVADSKSKKLPDGSWEELGSQWFRVTVWRELAEFYAERILRGTRVTVYGDFMSREFEKDGVKRLSLDVTAKGIDIHPKRDGQGQGRQAGSQGSQGGGWGGQQQDDSPPF